MNLPFATFSLFAPLAAVAAGADGPARPAAPVPHGAGPAERRPVRVLAIGNSFSQSLCRYFPEAAAAAGAPVEFCNLYIGGCPLDRHAENIRKAAEDPEFAPYAVTWFHADRPAAPAKFQSNVPQMLATQAWDVVTIQQASHKSWDPGTYRPAADEVVAEIRRLAPQAEIVVHQTWAYNAADPRFRPGEKSWGFDQAGMAGRVEDAYRKLADGFGLRTIPVGAAVRLRREALAAEGRVFDPASPDALAPGEKPDLRGDPVGNFWWKAGAEGGAQALQRDTIHLNRAGEYLQAMVWLGFFTGLDVRALDFAPPGTEAFAADLPGLRAAAARALSGAASGRAAAGRGPDAGT